GLNEVFAFSAPLLLFERATLDVQRAIELSQPLVTRPEIPEGEDPDAVRTDSIERDNSFEVLQRGIVLAANQAAHTEIVQRERLMIWIRRARRFDNVGQQLLALAPLTAPHQDLAVEVVDVES